MSKRRLPSLSSLRAFEAAARHESVKQAGEELSVTATAVSHQIRALEEVLGIALFLRRPRQLELTSKGRELQRVLETAFDNIAHTLARLTESSDRQAITLTTTPFAAVRLLLSWVHLLGEAHPAIDLRIHASHEPVALDGMISDMAIRHGNGHWPGLVAEKLFDTTLLPACTPGLVDRCQGDISCYPLLHLRPQKALVAPMDWARYIEKTGLTTLEVEAGLAFSDESHAVSAALNGQGVILMNRQLIEDELAGGRLVQPFGLELDDHAFYLVYPEGRRDDPSMRAVREWVLSIPLPGKERHDR
ncbi:LysR substrate-binding domain-containing protein [Vreelandella malpeensis]|uniref:LysR family transcriptional regulator n=1 Tax=Vreelandella malpeensis TaxID=1172368 RepID=A0ABS8DUN6_9GAMM|nr:LysR substrate-binding domain-containing protein [Halomonas malpeensis]MCB8890047.1 LysR family transcriptional regulator [Halomonas malpeensis]